MNKAAFMQKPIWKTTATLEALNSLNDKTLGEVLGMKFVEIGPDFLRMSMPVDNRTKQPAGLLHGGASAALAETIGSVASNLCLDSQKQAAVGVELNCSHLRGARSGTVFAKCSPFRIGKSMHVWHIEISDEREKTLSVSRLTVSVLDKPT